MASAPVHRFLRSMFALWPVRFGAAWMNRHLGHWLSVTDSQWLTAPASHAWPAMALDVANDLQRKLFYFPRIYSRFYGKNPFAKFLAHRLQPGGRFLDIGANVGFYALMAARLVGASGRVFAFEPEPRMHASLARTVALNNFTQVQTLPLALSDREGELPFHSARDGTASSLVDEVPEKQTRYARTTIARVASLDALIRAGELALPAVDLVKVDVEGEEVRTVRGMREYLAANGPTIWCEVRGPEGSTRAPGTAAGVAEELAPLGYRPHLLVGQALAPVEITTIRQRADVVFVR